MKTLVGAAVDLSGSDPAQSGHPPSDVDVAATCVIVAYHRAEMTRRLVACLTDPRLRIVVVNVEDDVRIRAIDGATVVPTAVNLGYAGGVNLGVAHSVGGVVVFMNDDVEATAEQVLTLVDHLAQTRVEVAVPLVEDAVGHVELGRRPPLGLAPRMLLIGHPLPTEATTVDAAWAPLVAVRADVIRAVPIPESYFLYWEEFDWFFQLRRHGMAVQVLPWVRIRHVGGGVANARPDRSRLLARNAVRCVRLTRGRWPAVRAWPVVVGWQFGQLVRGLLRGRPGPVHAHLAGLLAALAAWREI